MAISIKHSTLADNSFSSEGAIAWEAEHTLTGIGSMAVQDANNVAITGGKIDGTKIGEITPTTGKFTVVTATDGILGGTF